MDDMTFRSVSKTGSNVSVLAVNYRCVKPALASYVFKMQPFNCGYEFNSKLELY